MKREDFSTASQYGTAVHLSLARQIDNLNDPNLRAEVSLLKSAASESYGQKDSIRIDVIEKVGNGTVCVYDIKTGERGLSSARTVEIAQRVSSVYRDTQIVIITEVRPTR